MPNVSPLGYVPLAAADGHALAVGTNSEQVRILLQSVMQGMPVCMCQSPTDQGRVQLAAHALCLLFNVQVTWASPLLQTSHLPACCNPTGAPSLHTHPCQCDLV